MGYIIFSIAAYYVFTAYIEHLEKRIDDLQKMSK